MVHLCGRPIRNRGRCSLGRETAIQRMVWSEEGWLRTWGRSPTWCAQYDLHSSGESPPRTVVTGTVRLDKGVPPRGGI
jgi:beta-xylosidase